MTDKITITIRHYSSEALVDRSGNTAVFAGFTKGVTVFTVRIPPNCGELAWALETALFGIIGVCVYVEPRQVRVMFGDSQCPEAIRQMIEHVLTREGIEFEVSEEG